MERETERRDKGERERETAGAEGKIINPSRL